MNYVSLSRFHYRSPRYVLQAQDNTLIRIAGPQQIPWEESTEIRDISLSGLSFTADTELSPIIGEFIKIQFQVPSGPQMACFALVTRIQSLSNSLQLIGVRFVKLRMAHRITLNQHLGKKIKKQHELEAATNEINVYSQTTDRMNLIPQIFLSFFLFMTWLLLSYYLFPWIFH